MNTNIKRIKTKIINPEFFEPFNRGFVFTNDTIPEFSFIVLSKPVIDNNGNLQVKTNLTWSVDLLKNSSYEYNKITLSGEDTQDREFNLVMPLGDLGYNVCCGVSTTSQAIHDVVKGIFAIGNEITLKNISLHLSNKFGRVKLELLFDKIICNKSDVSGFLGEQLVNCFKYQASEQGFNSVNSMGISNLIYSLGANIHYITAEELKIRHDKLNSIDAEQKVKKVIKLAKAITPEKQAEIIKLRNEVGLSFAKIAMLFTVHKTTIIAHYHKCKAKEVTKLKGVSK